MNIDWTIVISAGITAAIIGSFQFITNRYLGRILDSIEKRSKKEEK